MKSLKYNQLYWRSRRGMLELDLQLQPFLEQSFPSLEDSEKEGYEKLLLEEDWQIYDWLRGVTAPVDEDVARTDTVILSYWRPPREQEDWHLISGRVEEAANSVRGAHVDVQHHCLGPASRMVVAMRHGDGQVLVWNGDRGWYGMIVLPGPAESLYNGRKICTCVAEQVIDAVCSQTGKERFGSGDRVRRCLGHDWGSS